MEIETALNKHYPKKPKQGPVGRIPKLYLDLLPHPIGKKKDPLGKGINIGRQLRRSDLRKICQDNQVDPLCAYAAVMAWGGMNLEHFKLSITTPNLLVDLLKYLRGTTADRLHDFNKLKAASIPGLGISFFSKVLYFFRPNHDSYILDQWTAKAYNLANPKAPIPLQWSSKKKFVCRPHPDKTTGDDYIQFCAWIESLGKQLKWKPDQVESGLFAGRGSPFRGYIRQQQVNLIKSGGSVPPVKTILNPSPCPCGGKGNPCSLWEKMVKCACLDKPVLLPTLGGRADPRWYFYDPEQDVIQVCNKTYHFQCTEIDFTLICQRYFQLGSANQLQTGQYTDPNWRNPPLGRINTPALVPVIPYLISCCSPGCQ